MTKRLRTGRGFAHQIEIALGTDETAQSAQHDGMIIGENDPDPCVHALSLSAAIGMLA